MDAPGLIPPLIGAPLSPRSGGIAGIVEDLLVDAASHRPVWLLVRLRDSERPYTFVPAERMASRTGAVVVPFDEKALREAPVRLASPSSCASEHAATLSRHYGVRHPARRSARPARPGGAGQSLAGVVSSRVRTTWASRPNGTGGSASANQRASSISPASTVSARPGDSASKQMTVVCLP
jgi:hypothetical protein